MRNYRALYISTERNNKRRNALVVEKQTETHSEFIVRIFLPFPDRPWILEFLDFIHGVKAEKENANDSFFERVALGQEAGDTYACF